MPGNKEPLRCRFGRRLSRAWAGEHLAYRSVFTYAVFVLIWSPWPPHRGGGSPSPGQRPGEGKSYAPTLDGPTGQRFSRRTFGPLGRQTRIDSPRSPGRCPGLGEQLGLRPETRRNPKTVDKPRRANKKNRNFPKTVDNQTVDNRDARANKKTRNFPKTVDNQTVDNPHARP